MKRSFSAEWSRLAQPRTWAVSLGATAVYAAVVSWVIIATAPDVAGAVNTGGQSPGGQSSGGEGPGGLSIRSLSESGGGTAAVSSAATFASVLILAVFIGMTAGAHQRGTWRAALLQQPNRLQLAGGSYLARMAFVASILAVLFAVGWLTALVVAGGYGVDTGEWLNAASWRDAAEDYLKVLVFAAGWGLLGTMVGALTRSVPVGLAIGVLWAGPIENVLGDNLDFGARWFPGLLLRDAVDTQVSSLTELQVWGTLAVYGVIVIALTGLVVQRRDVTS